MADVSLFVARLNRAAVSRQQEEVSTANQLQAQGMTRAKALRVAARITRRQETGSLYRTEKEVRHG